MDRKARLGYPKVRLIRLGSLGVPSLAALQAETAG